MLWKEVGWVGEKKIQCYTPLHWFTAECINQPSDFLYTLFYLNRVLTFTQQNLGARQKNILTDVWWAYGKKTKSNFESLLTVTPQ